MPTAIIADDEPILRQQLRQLLAMLWPELLILGEAEDGEKVVQLVREQHPDIAFLDIRMPGQSGLDAAVKINGFCRIVFVTAFDEYAIEAFRKQAIDYLLKPVSTERLGETIKRLQGDLDHARVPDQIIAQLRAQLMGELEKPYLHWLKAGRGGKVRLISTEEVCYLQAADKYTRIVTTDDEDLIRVSITELAKSLDPQRFWQIHRATIVNAAEIKHAARSMTGRYQIHLKSREEVLTVSRTYGHLFRQM